VSGARSGRDALAGGCPECLLSLLAAADWTLLGCGFRVRASPFLACLLSHLRLTTAASPCCRSHPAVDAQALRAPAGDSGGAEPGYRPFLRAASRGLRIGSRASLDGSLRWRLQLRSDSPPPRARASSPLGLTLPPHGARSWLSASGAGQRAHVSRSVSVHTFRQHAAIRAWQASRSVQDARAALLQAAPAHVSCARLTYADARRCGSFRAESA